MSQSAHESIPDWMLMAYADGELEPHEREAVAAYVAGNMAAAERMAGFQRSGRALGRLYDRSLREPVPDHLVDLVRGARLRQPAAPDLHALLGAPLRWLRPMAYAASAAVFAVAIAGGIVSRGGVAPDSSHPGPALRLALETSPTGHQTVAGTGSARTAITPVLTFASTSGHYCRQYLVTGAGSASMAGVGCRLDTGEWHIEAEVPATGTVAARKNGYAPASGSAPPAALETAIDRLIKGDALSPAEEARLISQRWQR